MFWLNFFLGVACSTAVAFGVAMTYAIVHDFRVMRLRASVPQYRREGR